MNKREAGQKGGLATFKKYGSSYMSEIGKKGFQATLSKPNGVYLFWHNQSFMKGYNRYKRNFGLR